MIQTIILAKGRAGADKACAFLTGLPKDKAWEVVIRPYASKRSDAQNAYWWSVPVRLLSEATGYEKDEVHEYLCGTHFGWKDRPAPKTPRNPKGLVSVPVRTTTRDENGNRSVLTKLEFMDLVEFAKRFGASKGVYIPDPGEHVT